MCGIFGTLNRPIERADELVRSLHHRGPDSYGSLVAGRLSLLHTRLAIQDEGPGGHQPIRQGRWIMAFNGEIYNHRTLRRQYGLSGPSTSDTATVLALWARLGTSLLPQLDGMFALILFDTLTEQLWLIRDRFGEKPLYLWQEGSQAVFCSDLRTLQRHLPLTTNQEALSRYCQLGYFLGNETPYQRVRQVRAGELIEINARSLAHHSRIWWADPCFKGAPAARKKELPPDLIGVLRQSVQQQLETTSRPVGVLLSGGLDSGLITALAARCQPGIRTFTLSMPDPHYDEAPLAQLVAGQYSTQHNTVRPELGTLADEVLRILPAYGEPFMDSSALPAYWLARAAREQVGVVLTGDGADELFGGYRRYVAARCGFFRLPGLLTKVMGGLYPCLPYPGHKQTAYSQLYRLVSLARTTGARRYLALTTDVITGYESALINPGALYELEALLQQTHSLSSLQQIQLVDRACLLAGDLLKKMDIATMAHSLEARNPFLGPEVVKLAMNLPDKAKIGWQSGIKTKCLLREVARPYLPARLIDGPKRGFEVPLEQWLAGPLRDLANDYLSQPTLVDTLLKPEFINKLLEQPHRFSPEKRARLLWMLLSVEIWHRNLYRHA